jgi:hypothetical protein
LRLLDVVLIEHGGHRLDALEEARDRLDVLVPVQHAGLEGGGIGVVRHRVPRAEDDVVE